MFLASKLKGIFVELNDATLIVGRTSAAAGPRIVEDLQEIPQQDEEQWRALVAKFSPQKGSHALLQAVCGVYPPERLLRRSTLDLKRLRETGYLNEFVSTQFRIDPEAYVLAMLNAADGREYDMAKGQVADVAICGMPTAEIASTQERLLKRSLYPERLEIGSVAVAGALCDYAKFKKLSAPILLLEMGRHATHSCIVSNEGLLAARPIPQGLESMVPVVQKELGLKDEDSARKLFYSNSFDFTGMGPALIKKLLRELQSSIGFFEVQTGHSIGSVVCTLLPPKLEWLENTLASQLAVEALSLDLVPWLGSHQITLGERVAGTPLSRRWLGLFSLMTQYHAEPTEK